MGTGSVHASTSIILPAVCQGRAFVFWGDSFSASKLRSAEGDTLLRVGVTELIRLLAGPRPESGIFLLASNLSAVLASPAELPRSRARALGNSSESVASESVGFPG